YRAGREGAERFPSSTAKWTHGFEALRMNFAEEALEAHRGIDPDNPAMEGVAGYWVTLAETLHALERHDEELREIGKGRERHPENLSLLEAEIRARAALGDIQEVMALVEEAEVREAEPLEILRIAALELRAHGHHQVSQELGERALAYLESRSGEVSATISHRFSVAQTLYRLERWEEALVIAEELAREAPTNRTYLGFLGWVAARRGDRQEAERISGELVAMERLYDHGQPAYIRAKIASLLGEKEQAVTLLRQAHDEGRPFTYLHIDMDLEPLRGYLQFEEFMRPKG
ncbi:tetratricopeptide repeat protein, partial [Gemmatimonadota bacterium]